MPSPSAIPVVCSSSSDSDLNPIQTNMIVRTKLVRRRQSNTKLSYWPHWSNMNVLGSENNVSVPDLTEENLESYNRRNASSVIHSWNNNNNSSYMVNKFIANDRCSPYYRGLIDATLSINRDRDREKTVTTDDILQNLNSPMQLTEDREGESAINTASSPGRESHVTNYSSTSSLTTLILKVQSCFPFKTPSSKAITGTGKEYSIVDTNSSCSKKKPLRERVSSALTSVDDQQQNSPDHDNVVEERFTWAKKYGPKGLNDFICNKKKATQLQGKLTDGGCGGHFIFEGPPGVGKRTMIRALLRDEFGSKAVETQDKRKAFDLKGEMIGRIEIDIKESALHVEINLSDMKGYEKDVIVELMKETQTVISNHVLASSPFICRAIVLHEADKLSTDALLYIRWLFERYKGCNHFFFCCSDHSKLQPIKSLCTIIQLFPPSRQEVIEVLQYVALQEGIDISVDIAEKIADNSKNNLRQALRSFEATFRYSSYISKEGEDRVILTGWEQDITNIAKDIIDEQSPKQLYIIRGKLQNLIEHDVSPEFIFKFLVDELKKLVEKHLQLPLENLYKEYNGDNDNIFDGEKPLIFARNRPNETSSRKNIKQFLRIEEFIAKFMSWYGKSSSQCVRGDEEAVAIIGED